MSDPSQVGKIMKATFGNWNQDAYENYLNIFKLPRKKKFKEFSRGMKMKLGIAVALSHHARLLILDVNCSTPLGCVFIILLNIITQLICMIFLNTFAIERLLSMLLVFLPLALGPAALLLPFIYKFGVNTG